MNTNKEAARFAELSPRKTAKIAVWRMKDFEVI